MKRGHEIKGSHCATKPPYSKARACYVPRSAQSFTFVQNFETLSHKDNKSLLPRQIMLFRLQKCCQNATLLIPLVMEESGFTGRPSVAPPSASPSILLRPSSSARATDDGARLPHICAALAFVSDERWQNGELNPLSLWHPRTDGTSCLLLENVHIA